jgi:hypothetical protein
MNFIDPEIIHRYEEERSLKALRFDPATVDILDINLFPVPSTLLNVFEVQII